MEKQTTNRVTVSKIIFINRFFYPDVSATSQLLTDLVIDLSKEGYEVDVVTSRNLYVGGKHKISQNSLPVKITAHYAWSSHFGRFGLIGRAADYLSFYITSTFVLLNVARQDDIIIAKTDPPLIAIPAKIIARLRKAKMINWLQDLFPEIAVELNLFPKRTRLLPLTLMLRNRSLRNADTNIVLGEQMKQKLIDARVPTEKIKIIPNWADDTFIQPIPADKNPLRTQWGLDGKFVVGYSGNLGRAHEFQTVLNAAEKLQSNPDIVFLWIGGGVQTETFKKQIASKKLTNFIFKDYQDRATLPVSLGVPDVHLVILSPNLEGLIVPSKFYGIAAAARPTIFIGHKNGEIPNLLTKHNCGISVQSGETKELEKAILKMKNNRQERVEQGLNARHALETYYSRKCASSTWVDLICELQQIEPKTIEMKAISTSGQIIKEVAKKTVSS